MSYDKHERTNKWKKFNFNVLNGNIQMTTIYIINQLHCNSYS